MNSSNSIRIFIADAHEMVREGLKIFLDTVDDFTFVGESTNSEETVHMCAEIQPDVLIIDFNLFASRDLRVIRLVRSASPGCRVIILTTIDDPKTVLASFQLGISGYLLKRVSIDDIADAVRIAHNGNTIIDPDLKDIHVHRKNQLPGLSFFCRFNRLYLLFRQYVENHPTRLKFAYH